MAWSAAGAVPRGRRTPCRPRRSRPPTAPARRRTDRGSPRAHRSSPTPRGCSSSRDQCRQRDSSQIRSLQAGGLAIDGGEQVVDVVALEQPLAKRLERRAAFLGRRLLLAVPPRRQFAELLLVLLALAVDRLPRLR